VDQELIQDRRSEGFEDDDPALLELNQRPHNEMERLEDVEEEEKEAGSNQNQNVLQVNNSQEWEEVDQNFQPNWLQRFIGELSPSQNFPVNTQQFSDYFGLFYDTEVLDHIVTETNRYGQQFLQSNPF